MTSSRVPDEPVRAAGFSPADPASASTAAPRGLRELLTDRTFGPWFWGNLVSNAGNWLFNVVAAVVVFDLTGSALLVGVVSVSQFLPLVVLSPWSGALSDRLDRRRLLVVGQSIAAVSAAGLAVPTVSLGVKALPGGWPVIAASLGIGIGQALAKPAQNSLVPLLVDDADLENAVSLTSLTFSVGRALGPGAAGALLVTWGAETAFVMNTVSYLVLIAAIIVLRVRPHERPAAGERSAWAGFRHVRADRGVVVLLISIGAAGFIADPVITLSAPLAALLGGGDALVAVLVSSFGVAAIPAAAVSGPLQRHVDGVALGAAGMVMAAVGFVLVGGAPSPWLAVTGFAMTGAGSTLAATSLTSVLQRRIVDRFRGRVMALWAVAFLGTRPLAALADGAAADAFGPRWAMSVGFLVSLAGAGLSLRVHGRSRSAESGAGRHGLRTERASSEHRARDG